MMISWPGKNSSEKLGISCDDESFLLRKHGGVPMSLLRKILLSLLPSLLIFVLGCQSDEERIRALVREELAAAMERHAIAAGQTVGPYTPAQRVGNFVFTSGQIALDRETGQLANTDIDTETRTAIENMLHILRSAGCDSGDVISTTIYLTDMRDYAAMNLIYGGYFEEGNYPARSTVQVAALPRGARIEISAIAYKHQ